MNIKSILAITVVLCIFSTAQANYIWSNPNGSADNFDWANGQSDNGLFGSPFVIGDGFRFFPSNFRAESTNGQTDTIDDKLEFELILHPGYCFQGISLTAQGDYGALTTGQVQANGTVSIENMDTSEVLSDNFTTTFDPGGTWLSSSQIGLSQTNWTHLKIIIENDFLAVAADSSAAFIQEKLLSCPITISTIPEPTTIAMLTIGSVLLFGKAGSKKT